MRWKEPAHGEVRVVKKFLLLKRTFNNETRWLEYADVKEQFYDTVHVSAPGWREIGFADDDIAKKLEDI